jgi:hypothetical protein
MKVLTVFLLLVSSAASAAPHWIEVKTSDGNVRLDDSSRLIDGAYQGYRLKLTFKEPLTLRGIDAPVLFEYLAIEVDCEKHLGRGMRLSLTDANSVEHVLPASWNVLEQAPATELGDLIKALVCH